MLYCCAPWAPVPYCAVRAPKNGAVYERGVGAGMVITQSTGNAPPRRTADTLHAAGEPDLPDVVVYAGGALFLAAAGGVVFPSCSRGWAAGGAVPVKIAAGTAAAAVTMRTTVAILSRVAGAAAHGASVADVLADGGPDYRRGTRLTTCSSDLCHGFHL